MNFINELLIEDQAQRVLNNIRKRNSKTSNAIDHPKKKNGRCRECGFRIRTKNHNEGEHHNVKHRYAAA